MAQTQCPNCGRVFVADGNYTVLNLPDHVFRMVTHGTVVLHECERQASTPPTAPTIPELRTSW